MSFVNSRDEQTVPVSKGKGKAHCQTSTERTPLLASQSLSRPEDQESITPTQRLRSKLAFVFLASLGVCIVAFICLAIIACSYVARISNITPEEILDRALVAQGPDRVDVLNVTESGGVWINVEGRIGIDAGSIIGLNKDSLGSDILNSIVRWGVRTIDRVTVRLNAINVSSSYDQESALASIDTSALELHLTVDPPNDFSWLTSVSVPVLIYPTPNSSAITHFARDAWRQGAIAVRAYIGKVVVQGGGLGEAGWRQTLKFDRYHVSTTVRVEIPPMPGLPTPGRNAPFPPLSDLITLQSFNVSSGSDKLSLHASATIIDPAPPTFNLTSPSMPFIISLPSCGNSSNFLDQKPIPIAAVSTEPFSLTHPNITLLISGTVLPLPPASTVFSAFLTAYLSAKSNPIIISTPLFPGLSIDADFPAPYPAPRILKDVTIRNMKIKPSAGGAFLASGTVYVRVTLPKGIHLDLDVKRVLPDVLIFDGEVPVSNHITTHQPEIPSLPDPLPEHAFAHIRPDDWLDSKSVPAESKEGEGSAVGVTAKIVDVPLEVLPGREKEFSAFVSKVIFGSGGALAGILGSTAVAVDVHGLPFRDGNGEGREMELDGLPFKGSVRVGKRGFFLEDTVNQRYRQVLDHR